MAPDADEPVEAAAAPPSSAPAPAAAFPLAVDDLQAEPTANNAAVQTASGPIFPRTTERMCVYLT